MPNNNPDHLENQAEQLVRWHRERYYPVAQRIREALPRFQGMDDAAILSSPFTLADAREMVVAGASRLDDGPRLLGAFPQLFVADVEVSCRFFVETLDFTLRFEYGQPPFYALIERGGARLNLRFVHKPVLLQDLGTDAEAERDLLAASIPVENIEALYAEYQGAGAPLHQALQEQPWGSRDFIVRDPDGNLIHFSE